MTAAQPPQNLPLAGALIEEETDAEGASQAGPAVGAADAEADAVRSGADTDAGPTRTAADSDGVPVGRDDLEADKRNSGA